MNEKNSVSESELVSQETSHNRRICIVGLGYVGLPLAVAFGKTKQITGFDISKKKILELSEGIESMGEIPEEELKLSKIKFTYDSEQIAFCDFVIVAVPTPVDEHKVPDMRYVAGASRIVGKNITKGTIVVFESTVYPGATEEICIPIIEEESGLKCGVDWKIGYSPERVNPGDKVHTTETIVKVVSGMDEESLEIIAQVYSSIIKAGVYRASSIKVAEAAKVIENTQRDLNIALMNELSLIFRKMNINTKDVIDAASTKWNFHRYTPGMVGGHCIGVDPYYLTYKAEELGYKPEVILAGRAINDSMSKHIAEIIVKELIKSDVMIKKAKVLILGLTFKENVRDARNSKTRDLIHELKEFGIEVVANDPYISKDDILHEGFNVENIALEDAKKVDAIIMTVPHREYLEISAEEYASMMNGSKIFFDVKGAMEREEFERAGVRYLEL
jgi:UDP-N-acetyl-D-glucosamine/UDP-N-acetyl-D-galactosamine dehydrogenase